MDPLVITEAETRRGFDLTSEEAEQLNRAGRLLASGPYWRDEEDQPERRVVECTQQADGWEIKARHIIGVIGLGDRALHIQPKIPLLHLMYLFAEAGVTPRLDTHLTGVQPDSEFVEVVAAWFITTIHRLVRLGLHRDYQELEEETSALQGQLVIPPTFLSLMRGQPYFTCRFDDYTYDNPPNRVIAEALRRLQRIPDLDTERRRQARGLLSEFPPTGAMSLNDLRYQPDRNALRYQTPLELARQIIASTGRRPEPGRDAGVGFVIPTPTNVENGLRNALQRLVPSTIKPHKRSRPLDGGFTIEPDLVFGQDSAVGDVKYRILGEKWNRSDVFQLTTYAAAYETTLGILIGFSNHLQEIDDLLVGPHRLRQFAWVASDDTDPSEEAARLAEAVVDFLES